MQELNQIGLVTTQAMNLSDKLNVLLVEYSIVYQNVRGYHWNIKGDKFFDLPFKFEELYSDLLIKIGKIAERILTLGFVPNHKYSVFNTITRIKDSTEVSDGLNAVDDI